MNNLKNRSSPSNFKISPNINKKLINQTNKNLIFEIGQMHPKSRSVKKSEHR